MRTTDLLTVSEVAERSGFAPSALRFYEREGLVHATRTARQPAPLRAQRAAPAGVHPGRAQRRAEPGRGRGGARRRCPTAARRPAADWTRLSRTWRHRLDDQIAALAEAARRPRLLHRLRLPVAADAARCRTRATSRPAPARARSYLPAPLRRVRAPRGVSHATARPSIDLGRRQLGQQRPPGRAIFERRSPLPITTTSRSSTAPVDEHRPLGRQADRGDAAVLHAGERRRRRPSARTRPCGRRAAGAPRR